MTDDHTGPLDYIEQTAVHQLRHAANDLESGDGLVADFDYDEDVNVSKSVYGKNLKEVSFDKERIVTLELTYLLPK